MENIEEFWLINSTFKRICDFVEKSGFKIRNTDFGIAFYFYPDAKVSNYDWVWVNKKELLLGSNHVYSLFLCIFSRYKYITRYNIKNTEPISEPISENTLNFINVCEFLNGCDSIEELAMKMNLMGI
jgi:hypothetical protein